MFTPSFSVAAFSAGFLLSVALIMVIGPQNAHILRMGLKRQHLWLTAAVCAFADILLITTGVYGASFVSVSAPWLQPMLLTVGVIFLLSYGSLAARRFWRGRAQVLTMVRAGTRGMAHTSRTQAVLTALAFSLLNPHAWIDTTVLIGGAALAYQDEGKTLFGLGAIVGSAVWFFLFAMFVGWLGHRVLYERVCRWIDAGVALTMWSIAAVLVLGALT